MNPMIIVFITSMFINDYFFKEGNLIKLYSYAVIGYVIFYCIQQHSTFHSPTKKLHMAAYNQSYDPTIYGKVNFDLSNARAFLEKKKKEIGHKISMTLYWIKVVGEVFKRLPECNEVIRFGLKAIRKEVDIGILVNDSSNSNDSGEGSELLKMTLRNVPGKTLKELSEEMRKGLVEKEDKDYDNTMKFLRLFPSFIIEILLEIGGLLSTVGINIPFVGLKYNLYGSVIVTSLGSKHLNEIYAPLIPFSQTVGVFSCCSIFSKKIMNKEGVYETKEFLPINFSIDHRYVDGVLCAKMVKEARKAFDDPDSFNVI